VPESAVDELLRRIAYERDAAWAAKHAVLRVSGMKEIAHFGACVREHARHAEELAQLVRAVDRRRARLSSLESLRAASCAPREAAA
jgi:hypothetical protein